MKITSPLYHPLFNLLGQSKAWADLRHLQTLCWMVIGLICGALYQPHLLEHLYRKPCACLLKAINVASVVGCTTVEENVHRLYKPIIQAALADWVCRVIRVIEDTTMLWNQYCPRSFIGSIPRSRCGSWVASVGTIK